MDGQTPAKAKGRNDTMEYQPLTIYQTHEAPGNSSGQVNLQVYDEIPQEKLENYSLDEISHNSATKKKSKKLTILDIQK